MNRSGTPIQNRPSTSADSLSNDGGAAYKTALKGASLAFHSTGSKQPQSAVGTTQARIIDNRALIAATSTSHHHGLAPSRSPPRDRPAGVSRQTTGNSLISSGNGGSDVEHGVAAGPKPPQPLQHSTQHQGFAVVPLLMPPGKQAMAGSRSPSFIAASLAASRSGSPSARQPAQSSHPYAQQAARRHQGDSASVQSAATSVTSLDLATDTDPLPSTNALITLFENKDCDGDPVKKRVAASYDSKPAASKPKPKPKPRSATPPRAPSPVTRPVSPPTRPENPRVRRKPVSPPARVKQPAGEKPLTQEPSTVVGSKKRPPAPPPPRSIKSDVGESISAKPVTPKRKPRASTPPRSISRANTVILSPQPRRVSSQNILAHKSSYDILEARPKTPPAVKPKPQHRASVDHVEKPSAPPKKPPPPTELAQQKHRPSSSSSDDTFVSASSAPSPQPDSPGRPGIPPSTPDPPRSARPASRQSTPARSQRRPPSLPQRQQQQQTLDIPLSSLTNAIMAGSLANSRLTPSKPPQKTSPTPPSSRRPTPRLRQTLRQPPSKSDDEDARRHHHHRRAKKAFGKSSKHAHQEGQRKRWREEITARERKRYEGVWASNRGYLLDRAPDGPHPNPGRNQNRSQGQGQNQGPKTPHRDDRSEVAEPENNNKRPLGEDGRDLVVNVVVRDIWARSRLPFDELAEVWDLVDRRGRGALDKTEFVVGMWLIDQRLRGRKIPRKVGDSVWWSANDVRVKGPKGGGGGGGGKGK
ncbi:hypothetical protein DL764_000640 [Monosporascus ibericus]|uniref:EH domain-containing protein n=1 Tax=Monosporascus ibericus TaxID=155417 RepID=A0A4Q4TW30_9PEZI|nr:hypothetical protein DL764_000640 [Monosporascus ibericus]